MSFLLGGQFVLPAARNISVLDEQVAALVSGDVRINITTIAGASPRLVGLDGASDGRVIFLYNGTSATTIALGPSTTNLNDSTINSNSTLNPRTGVWLRYQNEGPTQSGFRRWIVIAGA